MFSCSHLWILFTGFPDWVHSAISGTWYEGERALLVCLAVGVEFSCSGKTERSYILPSQSHRMGGLSGCPISSLYSLILCGYPLPYLAKPSALGFSCSILGNNLLPSQESWH
jgi:hypothetical protein